MPVAHPQSSSVSLAVPHTQNTAPVLEYRCLFTKDLRQKQKRWQDGRLKLHTFNKRVMVYDERSNNVGDTYWREDCDLEGEELELERGAALIQVGEFLGKKDQDLTDLVDKRAKEKEERHAARTASSPARPPSAATPAGSHLRPKPLNAVIGTPTGHYGRAMVPITTPFEERQRQLGGRNENENGRPAKRRKQMPSPPGKSGYAQNLFGPSMTLSKPPSSATSSYVVTRPSLHRPSVTSIDLTGEEDDNSRNSESALRENANRPISKPIRPKMRKKPTLASSTYAGNLTGAALTLSAPPGSQAIKRAALTSNTIRKAALPQSLSDDEDSSTEANLPLQASVAIPGKEKPTQISRPIPKPSRTGNLSSSPPPKNQATPLATGESRSTSRKSLPQSTLRIKARPRKQMMMLMELPSSRGSSKRPSNLMASSRRASEPAASEIEPSQATARLDSFIETQDARLQKRLKDRHVHVTEEEPASSLLDRGIDYKTIDALLIPDSTSSLSRGKMKSLKGSRKDPEPEEASASDNEDLNEAGQVPSSPEQISEATDPPWNHKASSPTQIDTINEERRGDGTRNRKQSEHSRAESLEAQKEKTSSEILQRRPSVNYEDPGIIDTVRDTASHTASANSQPSELVRLAQERKTAQRLAEEEQLKLLKLREELKIAQKKADEEREAQVRHRQALEKAIEEAARRKVLEQEKRKLEEQAIREAARQKALEQERQRVEEQATIEAARQEALKQEKQKLEEQAIKEAAQQKALEQERQRLEEQRKLEKEREDAARQQKLDEERRKLDDLRSEIKCLEEERLKEIAAREKRLQDERQAELSRQEELARVEREREIAATQKRLEEEKEADEMRKELAILRKEKELAAEQRRLDIMRQAEEEQQREAHEQAKREETQRIRDEDQRLEQLRALNEKESAAVPDAGASRDTISSKSFGASKNTFTRANNVVLPPHLDNAILSSTDRFRRMIQPSSRPIAGTHFDPPAQVTTLTGPSNMIPSLDHASKSFDADTQVEANTNNSRSSNGRARSVNGLNNSFEGPSIGSASMTHGVTKAFKLSRPTRGEATNRTLDSMQPPRRAGSNISLNDGGDQAVQASRKPTANGPWSREAFDLFTWRPPP